jgi:hypothetical protein
MAVPEFDLQIGKLFVPADQILQGLFRLYDVSLHKLQFRHLLDKAFRTEPPLTSLSLGAPTLLFQSIDLFCEFTFAATKTSKPSLLLGGQAFGP